MEAQIAVIVAALVDLLEHDFDGEANFAQIAEPLRARCGPAVVVPKRAAFRDLLQASGALELVERGGGHYVRLRERFHAIAYRAGIVQGTTEHLVRTAADAGAEIVGTLRWPKGEKPVLRVRDVRGDWLLLDAPRPSWVCAVVAGRRYLEPAGDAAGLALEAGRYFVAEPPAPAAVQPPQPPQLPLPQTPQASQAPQAVIARRAPTASAEFDSAFKSAGAAEERFGVEDSSSEFLEGRRATMAALAGASAGAKWLRVVGLSAIDGVIRHELNARAGGDAPRCRSDYEFTRSVRLGPDREPHRMFLGRWNPLPRDDRISPPRPRLVPDAGFVAIKCLEPQEFAAEGAVVIAELETHRRLQRLAHAAGRRHFVDLIDVFASEDDQGRLSIVLVQELCIGTLGDRLRSAVPLSERERFSIAWRVGRAICFMHSGGSAVARDDGGAFVHRDVRSSNVLIDSSGAVLLGDFGEARLAKRVVDLPPQTPALSFSPAAGSSPSVGDDVPSISLQRRGEFTFAPREVYSAGARIAASDVWSYGNLLFSCFARDALRPFVDEATQRLQHAERHALMHAAHKRSVLERCSPAWAFLRSDTPPSMAALIAWCLEHDVSRRPTMAAVLGHPAFCSTSQIIERGALMKSLMLTNGHGIARLVADTEGAGLCEAGETIVVLEGAHFAALPSRAVVARSAQRLAEYSSAVAAEAAGAGMRVSRPLCAPGTLYANASHFPLQGGTGVSQLVSWIRNVFAHARDGDAMGDFSVVYAMTRSGPAPAAAIWTDPLEFTLRHPDVAWVSPLLYRLCVVRRAQLLRGAGAGAGAGATRAMSRAELAVLVPRALLPAALALAPVLDGEGLVGAEDEYARMSES